MQSSDDSIQKVTQAESFIEDVNMIDENHHRRLPEHLRVPVADRTEYPTALSNMGKKINGVVMTCIQPILVALRFLRRRTNLTFWIITAMIVGVLIGQFAPKAAKEIKPLGDAFIMMIKIIIVPLVFSVLVIGIAGHGDDIGKVGFLAIKTIIVK